MHLRAIIGGNIRRLRLERGMVQDDLAHEADIHPTYLSGIENGRKNITVDLLERVANALDVLEEELVRRKR